MSQSFFLLAPYKKESPRLVYSWAKLQETVADNRLYNQLEIISIPYRLLSLFPGPALQAADLQCQCLSCDI